MFQRIGVMEIVLVIVLALLIFGPSKLPQLGRSIGESLREFKKSIRSISQEEAANDKEQTSDRKDT